MGNNIIIKGRGKGLSFVCSYFQNQTKPVIARTLTARVRITTIK